MTNIYFNRSHNVRYANLPDTVSESRIPLNIQYFNMPDTVIYYDMFNIF